MNRALRAATMGVLLLSPVALSACSAGQVTQTATQDRDKTGGQAKAGGITLRAAELEYPRGGSYDAGDDAELRLAIVNTGSETETLTAVGGDGFASAEISGAPAAASPATASAGAGGTGTAAPEEIEIPAGSTVYVGEDRVTIMLTGLDDDLTTGQALELTLTFQNAGDLTVMAPVATPDDEVERGEGFDFHQSSGEASGGQDGPG
ncbi:MAG: uncharacterized protein JWQ45_2085 [Blastococcus sp.]|nr:uncharacterized protein [Blastococcus sp.]